MALIKLARQVRAGTSELKSGRDRPEVAAFDFGGREVASFDFGSVIYKIK